MKFFSLLVLFFGLTLQAGQTQKSCEFKDYEDIRNALETQEVRIGNELRTTILGMLSQEMGPTCIKLAKKFGISIPGQKMKDYLIYNSEDSAFRVALISSLEEGKDFVVIQRQSGKQ